MAFLHWEFYLRVIYCIINIIVDICSKTKTEVLEISGKKITWIDSIKLGIFCAFTGLLIFLIVEVIWAQILKDTIIAQYESGLLIPIIISGFLLSVVISVIAALLSSQMIDKQYVFYAALIGFLANLILWALISYFSILKNYPEVIEDLTFGEKIIAIPKVLAYFGIYVLNDITVLWALSQFTYAIIFVIFLKLLGAKKATKGYGYNLKF